MRFKYFASLKPIILNKYDNIIHDFLLQHKQLTLGKMGSFTIITDPKPGEEAGNVIFVADKKAETSGTLIDLIAEKSNKGRGLVASDLESYLEQARQFINIGKPYIINDIGAVSLNKFGDYELSRNTGAPPAAASMQIEQHFLPDKPGMGARAGKRNGIMVLAVVIILLVLAGVGWGVYNMTQRKGDNTAGTDGAADTTAVVAPPPAAATVAVKPDSATAKPDSVMAPAAVTPAATGDSSRYKFVFETTTSGDRARARIAQLRSFGDPAAFDSSRNGDTAFVYRLFLRKKIAVADLPKVKDSIQVYLSRSVTVVKE